MLDDVDVDLLIQEVKTRPIIWDITHEEFKDRIKRRMAWEEICAALIENFSQNTVQEQEAIVKRIALKWKNLKDNYSRSTRKRTKSGQKAATGRQYIYAKQMSFLQESIALATTRSICDSSDNNSCPFFQFQQQKKEDGSLSKSETPPAVLATTEESTASSVRTMSKRKKDFESSPLQLKSESSLLQDKNTPTAVKPADEDKSFFDSLIPTIKRFNEDQRLSFRIRVLDVIKSIKYENEIHVPNIPSQPYSLFLPGHQQCSSFHPPHVNFPPCQCYYRPNSTIRNTAEGSTMTSPDIGTAFNLSQEPSLHSTKTTDKDNTSKTTNL